MGYIKTRFGKFNCIYWNLVILAFGNVLSEADTGGRFNDSVKTVHLSLSPYVGYGIKSKSMDQYDWIRIYMWVILQKNIFLKTLCSSETWHVMIAICKIC